MDAAPRKGTARCAQLARREVSQSRCSGSMWIRTAGQPAFGSGRVSAGVLTLLRSLIDNLFAVGWVEQAQGAIDLIVVAEQDHRIVRQEADVRAGVED